MNKYEEKRQARIDRLNEAADRAEKRASDTYDSARKMSEAIPADNCWTSFGAIRQKLSKTHKR